MSNEILNWVQEEKWKKVIYMLEGPPVFLCTMIVNT